MNYFLSKASKLIQTPVTIIASNHLTKMSSRLFVNRISESTYHVINPHDESQEYVINSPRIVYKMYSTVIPEFESWAKELVSTLRGEEFQFKMTELCGLLALTLNVGEHAFTENGQLSFQGSFTQQYFVRTMVSIVFGL